MRRSNVVVNASGQKNSSHKVAASNMNLDNINQPSSRLAKKHTYNAKISEDENEQKVTIDFG